MLTEPAGSRAATPDHSPPAGSHRPNVMGEGEEVADEFPRVVRTSADARETYALFTPQEVFESEQSAQLRRLDPSMAELQLDDVFRALVQPWQIDRKDVNGPHGNDWGQQHHADYWVSSDTGQVCFAAVPSDGLESCAVGQHFKDADSRSWRHYTGHDPAPGNEGGFHSCCIDVGHSRDGVNWTLVAKLSDFGLVLGKQAGLRVEFAALVRDDSEALIASLGSHDECRSLFFVERMPLPTGRVVLVDPAELSSHCGAAGTSEPLDGPAVPSGVGAGYYPVVLSKDASGRVCRITAVFHPERVSRISKRFPPVPGVSPHSSDDEALY